MYTSYNTLKWDYINNDGINIQLSLQKYSTKNKNKDIFNAFEQQRAIYSTLLFNWSKKLSTYGVIGIELIRILFKNKDIQQIKVNQITLNNKRRQKVAPFIFFYVRFIYYAAMKGHWFLFIVLQWIRREKYL